MDGETAKAIEGELEQRSGTDPGASSTIPSWPSGAAPRTRREPMRVSGPLGIHGDVAKAIVTVMGEVQRLKKEETNDFARYKYTSVDDFMDAIRPLCAEAGLGIVQDEESAEVVQGERMDQHGVVRQTVTLHTVFAFYLVHESGAAHGPIYRSVAVPAQGAQAYGSAQSYALKQFMRSLFMVATGDTDDPDATDPKDLAARKPQGRSKASRKPTAPKKATEAEPVVHGSQELSDAMLQRLMILCREVGVSEEQRNIMKIGAEVDSFTKLTQVKAERLARFLGDVKDGAKTTADLETWLAATKKRVSAELDAEARLDELGV